MKGSLYFLFLILQINLVFPQYSGNLAEQIRRQVQQSLREAQSLGQNIAQNFIHVRQQLRPINNFPNSYNHNIRPPRLPGKNLGQEITNMVNNELQPVYAMSVRYNMKNGVGGTTTITYNSGKQLIIEDGQRYTCSGNIVRGQCNGAKQPFQIVTTQDYCYTSTYAVINDHVCLATSPLNIINYNNQINCTSSDGSPVITLTKEEYQNLCGQATPLKAYYEYYADLNSPYHTDIPNPNPYVTCLNNEPNVCHFEDSPSGISSTVSNQNSFSSSFSFRN